MSEPGAKGEGELGLAADHVREAVRARLFNERPTSVRVGRFALLQKIGEGSMGVVFAARDGELDREVALKVLHSHDEMQAGRLLREAKAMARLTHPNVVTVYEAGASEGRVYLAMEFVRGRDLRRWLGEHKRSWRAVLPLLVDAAHGLAAAHAAGLVHRDFKPENVLVTADGRAKVADFGLARPVRDRDSTEAGLDEAPDSSGLPTITRTGAIAGTPAYMPPEVLDGGIADARGDQFSFCITAYEALCGRRPFAGTTLRELREHIDCGALQSIPPDRRVPRSLRRLLIKGLAALPHERHPSMAALARALAREQGRRRRRAFAAAAVLGVGVLVFALVRSPANGSAPCTGSADVWARSWTEERRTAMTDAIVATGHVAGASAAKRVSEAVDDYGGRWIDAHRDACLATRVRGELSVEALDLRMACLEGRRAHVDALVVSLSSADHAAVDRAVHAVQRLPAIDPCLDPQQQRWVEPLPDDSELRAQVLALQADVARAEVLDGLGHAQEAAELHERAQARADELGYRPTMARVRALRANRSPPTPAARDLLYDALAFAEASGYVDGQRMAWMALVTTHAFIGEYTDSERAARHARALIEHMGNDPVLAAELLNGQAFAQVEQSKFESAVQLIEEAVRTVSVLEENHYARGNMLGSLGTIYSLAERNEDALDAYERAYANLLANYGSEHPDVAHMMMNLGRITARLDQLDVSNEWYERALATFDAVGASDHPAAIFALNNLGQNYGDQGNYPEAIATVERAIAAQIRGVGENHRWLVRMRRGLAEIYLDAGDHAKAVAECERALEISEATFGDAHDETASTRRRLGRILFEAGDPLRARPLLERALEGHAAPGIPADHLAVTQYWLFRVLQGDPREQARARALAEDAIPALERSEERQRIRARELKAWLAERPRD